MKSCYNIHTIWIALIIMTLSTYAFGKLGFNGIGIMLFILLTSAIKGVFIIREYMELQGVSLLWRVIMYGWLWSVISVIAITYLLTI